MRKLIFIISTLSFIYTQCGPIGNVCGGLDSNGCCPGEPADCAGECGGESFIDTCGFCNVLDSCGEDCNGDFAGSAYIDPNCGEGLSCVGGNTGLEACKMDCNCEWGGGDFYCTQPNEFEFFQSSSQMFVFLEGAWIIEEDGYGEEISEEDWVGAFKDIDGDGIGDICVGSRNYFGYYSEIPVMGNDGSNYTEEYMSAGDIIKWKIYDASENSIINATPSSNITFIPNDIQILLGIAEDPPVSEPPTVYDASYTLDEDTSINIYLSASDPDGDNLTFNYINPNNGYAVLNDSMLTYYPDMNYYGTEYIDFWAYNESGEESNLATISLTINPVNDAPYLEFIHDASIESSQAFSCSLQASDIDGDALVYTATAIGNNATINIENNILTIMPEYGNNESIIVTLTVTDGLATGTTTFTINVYTSGCTAPDCCNYNPNANDDDGSCVCIDITDGYNCDGEMVDCAGVPNGNSYLDQCDVCDSDIYNDCIFDCAGEAYIPIIINEGFAQVAHSDILQGGLCEGDCDTWYCDQIILTSSAYNSFSNSNLEAGDYINIYVEENAETDVDDAQCRITNIIDNGNFAKIQGICKSEYIHNYDIDCSDQNYTVHDEMSQVNINIMEIENYIDACYVCGGENECLYSINDFIIHDMFVNDWVLTSDYNYSNLGCTDNLEIGDMELGLNITNDGLVTFYYEDQEDLPYETTNWGYLEDLDMLCFYDDDETIIIATSGQCYNYSFSGEEMIMQHNEIYDLNEGNCEIFTFSPGCLDYNTNTCNFFELGECLYPDDNYDCSGNCLAQTDCYGDCGGTAMVDDCSFCSGGNTDFEYNEFLGCDDVCFSGLEFDECSVCGGDGTSCQSQTLGDLNEDGNIDIVDIVNLVNTVLAWDYNPLGDMNEDGTNDIVDIVLLVNLILYGAPDDDVSIIGTWQAYEYNVWIGDNCDSLYYQLDGPIFDGSDMPEFDDETDEDCNGEQYTGYEHAQIWWAFDEDYNFISYEYQDSDELIEEMEDQDCDSLYTNCQYYEEQTIEKEFHIGQYAINENTLLLNTQTYLEFKDGTDANGYDQECNGYYEEESDYTFDNCIDGPWNDEDENSYTVEISSNEIIITEIYTEYYGEYEDTPFTFCEEIKFQRFDALQIGGCMDSTYTNYNPYATFNDGTCSFNECYRLNSHQEYPKLNTFKIFK